MEQQTPIPPKSSLGFPFILSKIVTPKFPSIVPHFTTPSTHQGRIFFALLAMNGALPAELKFRENTVTVNTLSNTNLVASVQVY